jgi:membrane protein
VAVAGLIFGAQATRGQIVGQLSGLVGEQGAQFIQTAMENTSRPDANILATAIGVITLVLGASGVFEQLQDALNTIWKAKPIPAPGILSLVLSRVVLFSMVLSIGFLLLVSLVLSAVLAALGYFLGDRLPVPGIVLQGVNILISFGVVTLLFALIFKVLPSVKLAWRDVWIGAAATALLFTVGQMLISLYLGLSSATSTYGAAGALVVILLWMYYSAQILLLGAEFTYVYSNRYGSHAPNAAAAPAAFIEAPIEPSSQPDYNLVRALFGIAGVALFVAGLLVSWGFRRRIER